MLLDEGLSALDAKLRQELRVELKEILTAGTTTIVVTHDQEEAMSLADHVILMDRGRVTQQGSPVELYGRPGNKFVAGVHRSLELVRGPCRGRGIPRGVQVPDGGGGQAPGAEADRAGHHRVRGVRPGRSGSPSWTAMPPTIGEADA